MTVGTEFIIFMDDICRRHDRDCDAPFLYKGEDAIFFSPSSVPDDVSAGDDIYTAAETGICKPFSEADTGNRKPLSGADMDKYNR